jgi:hypothetical protein
MSVHELISDAGSAHRVVIEQTRKLASKWDRSGLLEGLNGYDRQGMAVILENQATQLLGENSTTNPGGSGTAGEQWAGVALPLVRKVFGTIAAKNFVSVQPMNLPSGLVFFMDFKYGTAKQNRAVGDSLFGDTLDSPFTSFGNTTEGGLYGNGKFGYSINDAVVTGLAVNSSSVSFADVNYNDLFIATGSLTKYQVTASLFTNADFLAARAFIPSGSGVDFADLVLPEFTTFNKNAAGGEGLITFIVNSDAVGQIKGVFFTKQPTDTTRGDFEDRTGGPVDADTDINIPQIDLELKSETIVAKTRKLKAVWSPELAQDLNAYHSIDAEAELTSMLSDYVAMEIDLEILDMLIAAAPQAHTEYWSTQIGKVWEGTNFGFDSVTANQAWTNMTWFQTLGQKMQKLSNKIHQATMRGGANFAVVSPSVATILETIPGFAAGTDGDKAEFAAGVTKVGSYQNRFTVYKNPYMKENVMLMGFRGSQFLETGAVYAPYIPLIMTPLVYDPNNFTPRRGVMTRYAKKVVRPEFFGKIYIDGVNRL